MKALTVRQPYASLIMADPPLKEWETRTRRLLREGMVIAIHAGKMTYREADRMSTRFIAQSIEEFPELRCIEGMSFGSVLGIVEVVKVVHVGELDDAISDLERAFGFYDDGYAAKLKVLERFDTPIPAKGKLGLWEWQRP